MTWTPIDGIHFALMAKEFPEFDQSTLPAIPTDWIDNSWHNDASPSFVIEAARVQVFINEANESEREIAGERFHVLSTDDATLDHDLLSTNDWQEVLTLVTERAAHSVDKCRHRDSGRGFCIDCGEAI